MSYLSILILAIALSVDACVTSFSYGLKYENNRLKNSLLISLITGLFQGLMPVIGYFFTNFVRAYIAHYSNIIVFLIFTYLGIKFILEAFQKEREKILCIDLKCLLLIGIATSIDAFSAGISLSLYGNLILKPALLIALITFINANLGFWSGVKLRHFETKRMEIFAGLLLILLGVKAIL